MGFVKYNGVASYDLGIVIEHPPNYELPERDYETIHVPGKNGDVFIDSGSFKNVNRTYEIAIGGRDANFAKLSSKISKWLYSSNGYARLEDSYEPDYYRMAAFRNTDEIENVYGEAGKLKVVFDCKPQRFLKSGEAPVTVPSGSVITNPTTFASLPLITVRGSSTGSGVLIIGDYTVRIQNVRSQIVLNCELQDAYNGIVNRNGDIVLDGNRFPQLVPGDTEIQFNGAIQSVEVIPKWWTV